MPGAGKVLYTANPACVVGVSAVTVVSFVELSALPRMDWISVCHDASLLQWPDILCTLTTSGLGHSHLDETRDV